ncbi:hypothetical protein Hgul01_05338 [Herpetosiphon gulosus]|uniref:Uncharacterized protein n=1 Tax=Herpetosiphon gulosus TaxID=1973496 RepID=A0ABP9X827_9CHLR
MIVNRLLMGALFACLLVGCGRTSLSTQTGNQAQTFSTVPPHIPA